MNYGSWKSNEVLISDLLNRSRVEKGDIVDLLLLIKDVKELDRRLSEMEKLKCGNGRFKNVDSVNVEKLIVNIILRWRVIKMGI